MPSLCLKLAAALLVATVIASPSLGAESAHDQAGAAATSADDPGGLPGKSRGVTTGENGYAAQVGAPDTISRAPRDCSTASREEAVKPAAGSRGANTDAVDQACGGGGPIGSR